MTVTTTIRIATAQTIIRNEAPHDGEHPFPAIAANLADIAGKAREAAAQDADVLVLPEFCAQGIAADHWVCIPAGGLTQYLAWLDGAIFDYLCSLAKETGVALCGSVLTGEVPDFLPPVPGSPFTQAEAQREWSDWIKTYNALKPAGFRPVVKNTAFFIDDTGIVARYDKRNLWHPERAYVTPGDTFCAAFDTKWGRAGMMICKPGVSPLTQAGT